ncbi:aminoglycoside phosphotransferase family protein [Ktedonospora formicarum]|uniref:Aminoglycoside phosphotransferase domain-containing protein n=1 Tax=Ktedonospora formicarum TaxID=2778364 RepID=A0A8J3I367_9CHLR|nr:aminoglycoside phosphotransferase family protein [Ktedonospora formicarum]GHO47931.1 hypothetical protein KSX_60940 [Ktedonospora formicarum]
MPQENLHKLNDLSAIARIAKRVFPSSSCSIERVEEGVSTFVYRIIHGRETFYLRILPEEGQSFAPEIAVHERLRALGVRVPEIIYFEHCEAQLQRSIMVVSEIKGKPLSQSPELNQSEQESIAREGGRDLARINSVLVEGFGWIARDDPHPGSLRGEHQMHSAFALEYWEADLAFLAEQFLPIDDIERLNLVRTRYASWLDIPQAHLAHGDLDATHIFQHEGHYSGIIDFGEIRGTSPWYDLGHFSMRDGERLPFRLTPALMHGYADLAPLPASIEQYICLESLLINVRALARSLRKRPLDRYTHHQIMVLNTDLETLLRS